MQARIHIAEMILRGLQGYVAIGALVAFVFVLTLPRVESTAARATLGARILFLPGAMLLWPFVLIQSARKLHAGSARRQLRAHPSADPSRNKSTPRAE